MKLLPVILLILSACSETGAPDFCDNHREFHAAHAHTVVQLDVDYRADGSILTVLDAPLASLSENGVTAIAGQLQQAEEVFRLETTLSCRFGTPEIAIEGQRVQARYHASCPQSGQLRGLDITLFQLFPTVQEVEARISTPATRKHFLINRQCDRGLFHFNGTEGAGA